MRNVNNGNILGYVSIKGVISMEYERKTNNLTLTLVSLIEIEHKLKIGINLTSFNKFCLGKR